MWWATSLRIIVSASQGYQRIVMAFPVLRCISISVFLPSRQRHCTFTASGSSELRNAVNDWCNDHSHDIQLYVIIAVWNIWLVKDARKLLCCGKEHCYCENYEDELINCDILPVINMDSIFAKAAKLTADGRYRTCNLRTRCSKMLDSSIRT
jgi:hypothetical protein